MARRRPTYSAEFRAEAVRRARTTPESLPSIARELGISLGSLKAWLAATRPKDERELTDNERQELRRLRRENAQLRMEREILKKATAFFAKESE